MIARQQQKSICHVYLLLYPKQQSMPSCLQSNVPTGREVPQHKVGNDDSMHRLLVYSALCFTKPQDKQRISPLPPGQNLPSGGFGGHGSGSNRPGRVGIDGHVWARD